MTWNGLRTLYFCKAVISLIRYDITYTLRGFQGICAELGRSQLKAGTQCPPDSVDELDRAMRRAVAVYLKPVTCLHFAVASTWLQRAHGAPAQTVIGYQPIPFMGHAWVEVGGRILNDPSFSPRAFQVLFRS